MKFIYKLIIILSLVSCGEIEISSPKLPCIEGYLYNLVGELIINPETGGAIICTLYNEQIINGIPNDKPSKTVRP